MKILHFVVCLSLAQLLKAKGIKEIKSSSDEENNSEILKIIEGINSLKSSSCKSNLNYTVNAFLERQRWAVASKNKFIVI